MKIEASFQAINKISQIADYLFGERSIRTIFEFGSRYGEDTIEFTKKYPAAIVYAFECNPGTIEICRQNLKQFPNIILNEKAVSDKIGSVSFFVNDKEKTKTAWEDGNQGASSLFKASGKYPVEEYVQKEVIVNSITLSSFISEEKIEEIDIMWMDVQGAELMALRGLENQISKIKLLHVEVEFFEIYKDQPLFRDVNKFLKKNNFKLLGYTSYSEYAGDAVYLNRTFYNRYKVEQIKQNLLENRHEGFFKRICNFPARFSKALQKDR